MYAPHRLPKPPCGRVFLIATSTEDQQQQQPLQPPESINCCVKSWCAWTGTLPGGATATRMLAPPPPHHRSTPPTPFLNRLLPSFGAPAVEEDALGRSLFDALAAEHIPPGQQVVPAALPGQGRGLVATARISARQLVLAVPRAAILTPADAAQLSALRPLLAAAAAPPLPDWTLLALWLAEVASPSYKHTSATTAAYAALLPERTGCVLEWAAEEVALLGGSHLHTLAVDIRAAAEASLQEVSPLIRRAESEGIVPAGALTEEGLRRAFALLLSRLVRLEGIADGGGGDTADGGAVDALCPWADLLNHDSSSGAFLQWDSAQDAVVLRADRAYAPGDQVVGCYGSKTSGELLLSYGFLPAPGTNPHDGCLLRVGLESLKSLAGTAQQAEWKAAALRERGLPAERVFLLRLTAAPQGLLPFAAFLAAPVGDSAAAEHLCDQLCSGGDDSLSPELLVRGLEAVGRLCKSASTGYGVGLEDAKAQAEQLQRAGEGASRRAQVLEVLAQEHRVLSRTAFLMQTRLREARRAATAAAS